MATWNLTDFSRGLAISDFCEELSTPRDWEKLLKDIILQQRELVKFSEIARKRQYHLYSRSSGFTEEMERYYQDNHRQLENVDRRRLGQRRFLLEFVLSKREKAIIPVSDSSEQQWMEKQAELLGFSWEVIANEKLPLMLRFFCPYCKDFTRPRGWPHNVGCEWCFEGKCVHQERGGYYRKRRGRNYNRLEIRQKCLLIRKQNIEATQVSLK